MLRIDGSAGEGGGQILRTATALALLTGTPFELVAIRAGRARPGLRPQHLRAVKAALVMSNGRAEGVELGSQRLVFEPGPVCAGRYDFDIGTAGSTCLVLQTLCLPLAFTGKVSQVRIHGGTHVPFSPCFHYLDRHWRRFLEKMGLTLELDMPSAGFYPKGGGRLDATISPVTSLGALELDRRGPLRRVLGMSAVANLPGHLGERQRRRACARVAEAGYSCAIELETLSSPGRGTMLLLLAEFENTQACFVSLGRRGKRAEAVADDAVDALLGYLETDGAVDAFCADQLLLPLALASGDSVLSTVAVTRHLLTNADVIRQFLPVLIEIRGEVGAPGVVRVRP